VYNNNVEEVSLSSTESSNSDDNTTTLQSKIGCKGTINNWHWQRKRDLSLWKSLFLAIISLNENGPANYRRAVSVCPSWTLLSLF